MGSPDPTEFAKQREPRLNQKQSVWTTSRDDRQVARSSAHIGAKDNPNLELVYRFRWNPTQVIVIAVGIFLMALGGIGLARAGAEGITNATTPEVVVAAWHRTPLMSTIELGIGLLLVVSGAQRILPRALYRTAGALGMVFGIVLIAQPATFDSVLGASRNTGWLYALLGLGLLALGFGAPIVFEREQVTTLDDDRIGDRTSVRESLAGELDAVEPGDSATL